jgi:hypothetical protein
MTPNGDATIDRKITPQELHEVIAHAEDLIGVPLDDLLSAHRLDAAAESFTSMSCRQ